MFCKLISYCLNGIDTVPLTIEIDISDGLPSFDIVGLPDSAVRESKERVKTAIKNSNLPFPIKKITVNLAPADFKKEGSLYDLPIALGILCCMDIIPSQKLENILFAGELALDGSLRPVRNIITFITSLDPTNSIDYILPLANQEDLKLIDSDKIKYATHLLDVVNFLNSESTLPTHQKTKISPTNSISSIDFTDVKGQEVAKRALLISASGYHNVLLIGPPGSGKTMLAKRLPSILPPLSSKECLELTKIYTLADQLPPSKLIATRPFRSPHHTVSPVALIGGGQKAKPGEVSLAHKGILFLDELLEFNKKTLEVLRQPLESRTTTITRAKHTITYPSNFLFLASTNPCPCGYYPNQKKCSCDIPSIKRYLKNLSGPMLDRIDLQVETHPLTTDVLHHESTTSSATLYAQSEHAREVQLHRFRNQDITFNSEIPDRDLNKFCTLTPSAKTLLNEWFEHNAVSMRSYSRVLKVGRTIADLDQSQDISEPHIAEAIGYRLLDGKFWT